MHIIIYFDIFFLYFKMFLTNNELLKRNIKQTVISQMGYLDVVIPPDFVAEETSGDVMVPEGGTVRVSCHARGLPPPRVMWKREDGSSIVLRDANGSKNKGLIVLSEYYFIIYLPDCCLIDSWLITSIHCCYFCTTDINFIVPI